MAVTYKYGAENAESSCKKAELEVWYGDEQRDVEEDAHSAAHDLERRADRRRARVIVRTHAGTCDVLRVRIQSC